MDGKPTIRDVAEAAGVSESTVSRVLNESKTQIPISRETRERVMRAAERLKYRPHPFAQALRGKRTGMLGLIVRTIDDPLFAQLIEAIGDAASQTGRRLLLGYAKRDPDEALALSQILDVRVCDGLLIVGDLRESPEDLKLLDQIEGQHVVSLCRGSEGGLVAGHPSVSVDNATGARMALDYLVGLGHRRIAFIHGSRQGDLYERMQAYLRFVEERLGGFRSDYLESDENTAGGGCQAMGRLLSLSDPPTAVFAADDLMAIGALQAVSDAGCVVPRDVSVIGFDDIRLTAYTHPPLTTIRQPIELIAKKGLELLLESTDQDIAFPRGPHVLVEPELIVRGSCAGIRGADSSC